MQLNKAIGQQGLWSGVHDLMDVSLSARCRHQYSQWNHCSLLVADVNERAVLTVSFEVRYCLHVMSWCKLPDIA
jgi:hypothetical protein